MAGDVVELAARIRTLRSGLGLSQAALAETLGVTSVTVSRWEHGHSRPTSAVQRRLEGLRADREQPSTDGTSGLRVPKKGRSGAPSNSFVGRASQLEALAQALRHTDTRLLTLVGTGGIGKTRLAAELTD